MLLLQLLSLLFRGRICFKDSFEDRFGVYLSAEEAGLDQICDGLEPRAVVWIRSLNALRRDAMNGLLFFK